MWEIATGGLRFQVEHSLIDHTVPFSGPFFVATKPGVNERDILICDSLACLPARHLSTPPNAEKSWAKLDIRDGGEGYQYMRDLASVPKDTVVILDKQLRTVTPVKLAVLEGLVRDLDDGKFEVRDRARQQLEELGEVAKLALTKALEGKPSVESQRQIKALLDAMNSLPSGDRLRKLRALEVLEMIGSPEACGVLKRLASGAPEATLTRQAKAALECLDAN